MDARLHHRCLHLGRKFRVLSIVDEFTRVCLALRADISQPSTKVVAALEEIAHCRGVPQRLIIDNGPEFVAKALDALGLCVAR